MEIVCTQGTVAKCGDDTVVHIHLVVDNEEETRVGHLSKGSIIFSTAEVVIGELEEQIFRKKDDCTVLFVIASKTCFRLGLLNCYYIIVINYPPSIKRLIYFTGYVQP